VVARRVQKFILCVRSIACVGTKFETETNTDAQKTVLPSDLLDKIQDGGGRHLKILFNGWTLELGRYCMYWHMSHHYKILTSPLHIVRSILLAV